MKSEEQIINLMAECAKKNSSLPEDGD